MNKTTLFRAAVVMMTAWIAAGTLWAQSGGPKKGTQSNPYDWSTTAAQLKNADIPVRAYIKTGSGKVRKVRADEIKWAKNEARRKGISGKIAAPEAKPAAAHPPEPPVFREDFETADSGSAVAESEEDTT